MSYGGWKLDLEAHEELAWSEVKIDGYWDFERDRNDQPNIGIGSCHGFDEGSVSLVLVVKCKADGSYCSYVVLFALLVAHVLFSPS